VLYWLHRNLKEEAMDYTDACARLKQAASLGSRPGLDSIRRLCARLGDPQDVVPAVHVAGTNGKGSVCAMIASILQAAGYRTGLYTSPYLTDWRDSFAVGGKKIAKAEFARAITPVLGQADAMAAEGIYATEFEILTACAFHWFRERGCDIAVIETGMGGRLDATNAIAHPALSVITAISYDHTAYLGDTLAQIAMEKCGIIKPGGVTVCDPAQPEEAMQVIREAAQRNENALIVPDMQQLTAISADVTGVSLVYRRIRAHIRMGGSHQARNAATAIEAALVLRKKGYTIPDAAIQKGLGAACLPARQEVLRVKPLVLLDGAHNLQGIQALAQTVRGITNRPLAVVMGMLADKPYREAIPIMASLCGRFCAVQPDNPRALPARAAADIARRHCENVQAYERVEDAVKAAADFAGSGGTVVICGSFYITVAARRAVNRHIPIAKSHGACYSHHRCTE
jgi:dihydrofolate synthase/folylpolyglutamate synthase